MKFSYSYLRKLVPLIKSKKQLVDVLNKRVFEVEEVEGDTIDVSVPPNRFSDASGHFGIAREIAAAMGNKFEYPQFRKLEIKKRKTGGGLISIDDKKKCKRYMGAIFFNVSVTDSPVEIKKVLRSCGIQSINNVVDIMNFVMLETGQPMHVFDLDQVYGKIVVRKAKRGEKLITLDGKRIIFAGDELVIADSKGPLAIAGIKGGNRAEVTGKTKRIFVESASFDSLSIYITSRNLGIVTDASLRFSRNISNALAEIGMMRTRDLLEKYAESKFEVWIDSNKKNISKKIIKINTKKFYKFIGVEMSANEIIKILDRLGFKIILEKGGDMETEFFVEAPTIRGDINEFVDVAEELVRINGFNNLKSEAPIFKVETARLEEDVEFSDKLKDFLSRMGFNEIYSSSFLPEGYVDIYKDAPEVKNPPSERYRYLRPTLEAGFIKVAEKNLKSDDEIRFFEIGKVFKVENNKKIKEKTYLGIAIVSKDNNKNVEFLVKGSVVNLIKMLGITDFEFVESKFKHDSEFVNDHLDIIIDERKIGRLKSISLGAYRMGFAELNADELMEIEEGEYEFTKIPKFPASEKDISFIVSKNQRIGKLIEKIYLVDTEIIRIVDLIDEYEDELFDSDKISVTFRIVFQSENKTLQDVEINKVLKKIKSELKKIGVKERI